MTDPMFEPRSFQPLLAGQPRSPAEGRPEASEAWDAIRPSALVHRVRWHTGLSQAAFAEAYRIDPDHLRALERGAVQPDSALVAYLTVIDRQPALVRGALQAN